MDIKIRVVLVEDDPQLLDGMKTLLEDSGRVDVLNAFQNAEDFMKQITALSPQVVLMDIGLPGMSGIQCVAAAKEQAPAIQFVMWTTFEDDEKIFEALRAGATGYLLKNSSIQSIVDAVQDVVNGGSPMSSSIARKVTQSFRPSTNVMDTHHLTAREREILGWLGKGHRYKEIAALLSISEETVRKHIRNMYEKLHVQSKVEALNKVFPGR